MSDKLMLEIAVRALENIRQSMATNNGLRSQTIADKAIGDLMDVSNSVKCLKDALKFWEEECQYLVTLTEEDGEHRETHNVFDDDPDWVINARKIFLEKFLQEEANK